MVLGKHHGISDEARVMKISILLVALSRKQFCPETSPIDQTARFSIPSIPPTKGDGDEMGISPGCPSNRVRSRAILSSFPKVHRSIKYLPRVLPLKKNFYLISVRKNRRPLLEKPSP